MSVSFDEDVLYVEIEPVTVEITIDPQTPTVDVSSVPLGAVDFTEEIVTLEVADPPVIEIAPAVVGVEISASGLQGPPGPASTVPGPPGPPGEVTVTGKLSYTHEQVNPDTTWHIQHDLGYKPNVTAVDSGGTAQYGEITYVDENNLVVTFLTSFGGKAYCT